MNSRHNIIFIQVSVSDKVLWCSKWHRRCPCARSSVLYMVKFGPHCCSYKVNAAMDVGTENTIRLPSLEQLIYWLSYGFT